METEQKEGRQAAAEPLSFWQIVSADAAAIGYSVDANKTLLGRVLAVRRCARIRPGFACVFWLRVNQIFARRGWRGHYRLKIWRFYRFANDISEHAIIGPGLCLPHPTDVTIGSRVRIGAGATIYNGVTLGAKDPKKPGAAMPRLGDRVTVYSGAKIIGPVEIGDDAVIGANAVCLKNVPAGSTMYGIPPNISIKPGS